MPYALTFAGLVLVITGFNNTYSALGRQLRADFTGSNSFLIWVVAIAAVGALGYVNSLRTFSHYFMLLILVSIFLANQGFFAKFTQAINSGPVAPAANAPSGSSTASLDTGNLLGTASQVLPTLLG